MEKLMHYVWQHRLVRAEDLVTVDGRKVQVIDPGRLNRDAGPDFFNAKVRIGDRLWAGDVEMHLRASDWHRHGHDRDRAYDSVVLHVVDRDDVAVHRGNGEVIPQMVMRCTPDFNIRYDNLVGRSDIDLPCAPHIADISRLHIADWLGSLGFERLYAKCDRLTALMTDYPGDWERAFYITLSRALGFGLNAEPMERLALAVPLPFLRKHSDSLTSVEALLFGQSGLLDAPGLAADSYVERLRSEYDFLRHKFSLRPVESPGWKMGRTRPSNLPHRRIATLAALVAGDFRPVGRILEMTSPEECVEMFRTPLTGYWSGRYILGGPVSDRMVETMSRSSAMVLVINVAVPLLMAFGMSHGREDLVARSTDWLHELAPERNSIVALFAAAGIAARDAFESQALIQLRREYCEKHKCMYCRIGHRILAAMVRK